jgi:hypothetical protein
MLRLQQCLPTKTAAICSDSTQQAVSAASECAALAVASTSLKSINGSQGFSIDSLNDLQLLDDVVTDISNKLRTIVETSASTDTTATTASIGTAESSLLMSADSLNTASANNGFGRPLDRAAYTVLPKVLESLQVQPCDITRMHDYPIGRGGFAEVYKVNLTTSSDKGTTTNRVCAAKVSDACVYYYQQRVYMHILVHVCMLSTAAMLLVSKLACSESEYTQFM